MLTSYLLYCLKTTHPFPPPAQGTPTGHHPQALCHPWGLWAQPVMVVWVLGALRPVTILSEDGKAEQV